MPSIDHLLGHTASQLRLMTDEEILSKYADCFKLEPVVPIKVEAEVSETTEGEEPVKVKKPRKPKDTTLKNGLLDLAKMQDMLAKAKQAALDKSTTAKPPA